MKKTILVFCCIISGFIFSQEIAPPPVALPNSNQTKLIDELISISHYKEALINYSRTYLWGEQYKDGKRRYENKHIDEVLKNFEFEKFKKNSIYNSFSFVSEKKLKKLIEFYKDNEGQINTANDMILITASISHNLQYQLNSEIEKVLKN
ncbi:hypothetical protein A0O34_07665 [Chryseobacterium glaciei]|uniref:Uncharacterized protein n=1 Tax=Chryseobacterium glaciei TaxID=1685010 RepID=A0A172XU40_9FLAO|nr:hypothetical protein [Chryseobacterium glaciei]ANF50400.1 hypothetical protein A0O34_07665 [Chryseobacterium glaciei]